MCAGDLITAFGSNLHGIRSLTAAEFPVEEKWRIGCLKNYLEKRYIMMANYQDTAEIDSLIESICTS